MNSSFQSRAYYSSIFFAVLAVAASYLLANIFSNIQTHENYFGWLSIAQFFGLGAAMLCAWYYAPNKYSLQDYRFFLAVGIAVRLILIPLDSYTSNDVSRYLFDGKLAFEGFDPYRISHDALELMALKAQWMPPEEHAQYVTLYPPLALLLFSFSASFGIGHAVIVWKLLTALASIFTMLLAGNVLRQMQKDKHLALLVLSPILILEAGVGGHVDSFSALLVAACLWAWQRGLAAMAGVFIALGTLVKLLPLALLGPLFLLSKRIKTAAVLVVSCLLSIVCGYGLSFVLGFKPIGSIGVFFQKWRFGSTLFQSLESHFSEMHLLIGIGILLLLGIFLVAGYCFNAHIKKTINFDVAISASQYILALPLLLSPVVFPWYLMPLAVLLALKPKCWLLAWLLLMPMTYEVLNQFTCCNHWLPAQWSLWLMAMGLSVGAMVDVTRIYSTRSRTLDDEAALNHEVQ